ncbi:OLC1v1004822C1 [Oldenlandia corymbosa var. corymbosa]|uniref:OLC1v1004822C1 n=1 Tax=Oldenlandia corymbosa var. corymbosa TaxID=529605 RepID=A0AAV1DFV7_OLDCO|nr:OLC1v1004822C1 [Oldenlandia corymbosa var. corymbosa]
MPQPKEKTASALQLIHESTSGETSLATQASDQQVAVDGEKASNRSPKQIAVDVSIDEAPSSQRAAQQTLAVQQTLAANPDVVAATENHPSLEVLKVVAGSEELATSPEEENRQESCVIEPSNYGCKRITRNWRNHYLLIRIS